MFHTSPSVRYQIDAGQSRFTVRAFVGGLLSGFGHNHTMAIRDFWGGVEFSPDRIESSALQIGVRADSLAITDKVSDNDRRKIERRMREEVLESARYPELKLPKLECFSKQNGR